MSLSVELYNDVFTSPRPYDTSSAVHERDIYLDNCLDLVKGLIVHWVDAAELSNDLMSSILPTYDSELPKKYWRYYRNMAGEYTEVDPPIYIQSLDTFEKIELTVANLSIHISTREELRTNVAYRDILLATYPTNDVLVMGIINPIPTSISTVAKDAEILYYPPHLVQFNEYSLIEDIQTWITYHRDRWYNAQYIHADELYTASYYCTLWPALYNLILQLREDRIHTLEVHYFHVQQHLASNGLLDRHMPVMSHEQILWLYRNIKYIKKHAGHNKSFTMLIENILDPSRIPLTGYNMALVNGGLGVEARFYRNKYSIEESLDTDEHNLDEYRNIETQVLANIARSVPVDLLADVDEGDFEIGGQYSELNTHISAPLQKDRVLHSTYGQQKTKMLESSVVDYGNTAIYSTLNILHDHWLHMSFNGTYTAFIRVEDIDENESINITVRNAYILMRVMMDEILIADNQFNQTTDTPNEIIMHTAEVIQTLTHIDYMDYVHLGDFRSIKAAVEFVNYNLEPVNQYISAKAFHIQIDRVSNGFTAIHEYLNAHTDVRTRLALDMMVNDIYRKHDVTENVINIEQWRASEGITTNPVLTEDKIKLYQGIIVAATGFQEDDISKTKIQTSLIDLMRQLTSYGVSYAINADHQPIHAMTCPEIHVINIINYSLVKLYVDLTANVMNATTVEHQTIYFEENIRPISAIDNTVVLLDNEIEMSMERVAVYNYDTERNNITIEDNL